MDKPKAERALKAVELKYRKYLSFEENQQYHPKLIQNWSLSGKPAEWAIVWEEGSPDEWALKWGSTRREDPTGIYTEALCSFALGVYDGD